MLLYNVERTFSYPLIYFALESFLTVFPTNFFEWHTLCMAGIKMTTSSNSLVLFNRPYTETGHLDSSADGSQLEDELESGEQRLFWHEDSKPGTLV